MHAQHIKVQTLAFTNVGGAISSDQSTTIQAPLVVNLGSDLSTKGRLSIDSLFHFNWFGVERAFDLNDRSLVSNSFGGILLPNLPNSWSELVTPSRLNSLARMGFAQALPNYRHLVSLGFMALPNFSEQMISSAVFLFENCCSRDKAKQLPRKIYDLTVSSIADHYRQYQNYKDIFHQTKASDVRKMAIKSLGGRIRQLKDSLQKFDASDALPLTMDGINFILKMNHYIHTFQGIYPELKAEDSPEAAISTSPTEDLKDSYCAKACNLLGDLGIQALGLSMNIQSGIHHNYGGILGVNLTQSSWDEVNKGVQCGWNFAGSYGYGVNKGLLVGRNLVVSGSSYENYGVFSGLNSASVLMDQCFKNHEGAEFELSNFFMRAGAFSNDGNSDFKQGTIKLESLEQSATGYLSLEKIEAAVKGDANILGQYSLKVKTTLTAQNVGIDGTGTLNQSSIIAVETLKQQGRIETQDAILTGHKVSLNGMAAEGGHIEARGHLNIEHSKTKDTGLSATSAHLSDSTFIAQKPETNDSLQSPDAEGSTQVAGNQIQVTGDLSTERVVMQGMQINSGSHKDEDGVYRNTSLNSRGNFDGKSSRLEQNCALNADNVGFTGNSAVHNSSANAVHTLIQQGNLEALEGILSGNNVTLKGTTAQRGHVEARGHLNIQHSETKYTVLSATSAHLSDSTFTAQPETNDSLQSPVLEGNTQVAGNQIQVAEDLSTVRVIMQGMQINSGSHKDEDGVYRNTSLNNRGDFDGKSSRLEQNSALTADNVGFTGNNVQMHATERTFKGKYDTEKEYIKATIVGGKGDAETEGAGVLINAKGKVIVDASDVSAKGEVIIYGENGVEVQARSHSYLAHKKKKVKRLLCIKYGQTLIEQTLTATCTTVFASEEGKVKILSKEGDMTGVAAQFIAAQGTTINQKRITLKGLPTQSTTKTKRQYFRHLIKTHGKQVSQGIKPVNFVSGGGETVLHADEGNIDGTDVRFQGKGSLRFETPNGDTYLRSSKLNHRIKEKRQTIEVSAPLVDTAKRIIKGDVKGVVQQAVPALSRLQGLINAQNPAEAAAGIFNTGVHGYNDISALQNGVMGDHILQNLGCVPKVNLRLSQTESDIRYQTASAAGVFQDGDVSFAAKGNIKLEGMPIFVDNLTMKAREIAMNGHSLKASTDRKTNSFTLGLSMTGQVTDAGIARGRETTKSTHYQNMQVQVKNKVHIDARQLTLDAANIGCHSIRGKINHLTIQSRQNEFQAKAYSASASTTGVVSMSASESTSRLLHQVAGIHVQIRDTTQHLSLDVPVELVTHGLKFFKQLAPKQRLPKIVQPNPLMKTFDEDAIAVTAEEPVVMTGLHEEQKPEPKSEGAAEDYIEASDPDKISGGFNPRPKMQRVGVKKGAGGRQRLFKRPNGQYTTLAKELRESAQKSQSTEVAEIILVTAGEKGNGLYYKAKIDAINQQFVLEGEFGKQFCFNVINRNKDLGPIGHMDLYIDACSAEALTKVQVQSGANGVRAFAQAEVGVGGPSATVTYDSPTFNWMGFSFQLNAQASAGVGAKVVVGAEVDVDAKKLKASFSARFGAFWGIGASKRVQFNLGVDPKYAECFDVACQKEIYDDPVGMDVIKKLKANVFLEEWESDYLDSMMLNVGIRADFERWQRGP